MININKYKIINKYQTNYNKYLSAGNTQWWHGRQTSSHNQ